MTTTTTKAYAFTLILAGVDVLEPEMGEAILAAGRHEVLPFSRDGSVGVHFDREAESLGEAVGSAIRDIERAGYPVARIEIEPPEAE